MAIGSHGGVSYRTDDQMRTGRRNIAQTHGVGGYVDHSPDPIGRFRARWGCVPGTLTVRLFSVYFTQQQGCGGNYADDLFTNVVLRSSGGRDWRLVSGGANVAALNTENLLGVSHLKGLKSSYTIKFV